MESLKENGCYFRLGYYDRNLSIPFIETLFFLGRGLFGTASDIYFFQNAQSYLEKAFACTLEECDLAGIIGLSFDDLGDIVDWDGLTNELSENKRLQDGGGFLSQRRS